MTRSARSVPQSLVVAAVALALLALPAVPAQSQGAGVSTTVITIDTLAAGTTIRNGQQILIGGWAVDTAGLGTGVDQVRIYLDGTMEAGGIPLGNATTGGYRPDVAQAFGNPAFANAGFDFLWTPRDLSPGPHTIFVYAHAIAANAWSYKSVSVTVLAEPTPTPSPTPPAYGPPYAPGMAGLPYPYELVPPPPPPPPPPPLIDGQICVLIYPPPPGCPGSVLPAPTGVTVGAATATTVTLIWTAVPGAVTYQVQQETPNGTFVPITVANLTPVSATIIGLAPLTTYRFRVVAIDAAGRPGLPSAIVTVTTTAGP